MIGKIARTVLPTRVVEAIKVLRNGVSTEILPNATYDQDGLITVHNCDFIYDPQFATAYKTGEDLDSWFGGKVHWRVHTLFWAASRALALEGDLVECGVHRGGFSRAVAEFVDLAQQKDRKFYLLDNFEGLSAEQVTQAEKENGIFEYPYSSDYEAVVEAFSDFQNVVIVKGDIPVTLDQVKSDKISSLSIDLNCAAPEIAAAEFFWDKLVSGASIVLDDYGWAKHIVQKHAFDDFARRRGVPILSLPTGQGLIIKQ